MTTLTPKYYQGSANSVNRPIQQKFQETVSVLDFGADSTGATDSYSAFVAAWNNIKNTGGILLIPRGNYLLNTTWTIDVQQNECFISAYGATITNGTAVTGYAIVITGGGNYGQCVIEGIAIDHSTNITATGGIELLNTSYPKVIRNQIRGNTLITSYTAIRAADSFWAIIYNNTIFSYGTSIEIYGESNTLRIEKNQINNGINGVIFKPNGTTVPNAVKIIDNDFQSNTYSINILTDSSYYVPDGVIISFNRVEATTAFISFSGSSASQQGPQPLLSTNNYLIYGNVTNYLLNPNNQTVNILESHYYPVIPGLVNSIGGPSNFNIRTSDTGCNLQVQDHNGSSSWSEGHFVFGNTYNPQHLWVDSNGSLRIKNGAPTSDFDGTVVGTQT